LERRVFVLHISWWGKKAIDYIVNRLMTWPALFDLDNWNRTSKITNEVIQNLQKIENIKKNFYWMLLRDWKEQCDVVYWKHDLLEKDFIGDFFAPYAESNCDSLFSESSWIKLYQIWSENHCNFISGINPIVLLRMSWDKFC